MEMNGVDADRSLTMRPRGDFAKWPSARRARAASGWALMSGDACGQRSAAMRDRVTILPCVRFHSRISSCPLRGSHSVIPG